MVLKRHQSISHHKDFEGEKERTNHKKFTRTLSNPDIISNKDGNTFKNEINRSMQRKPSSTDDPPLTMKAIKSQIKLERKRNLLYDKLKSVHHEQPSIFSSSSGFDNYRGIINLCLLLLVLSNFRLALDNVLKYGILVDPSFVLVALEDPYNWPCTILFLCSNIFIQVCFQLEKALSEKTLSERAGLIFNMINCFILIFMPIIVVLIFKPLPWFATVTLCWYTGLFLKLVSYVSVNKWCREEKLSKKLRDPVMKPAGPVAYPQNLSQQDLYYFVIAPTFCYELNIPRANKIRKRFLFRRIAEAVFLSGLMVALVQQWLVPTVKNSLKPFREMDFPRFFERIMKLAIPNHVIWLIFFYTYFHSGLNLVAELIRFGDREFYKDWWNAPNITYFWQNWNIPIHRWCRRHVYEPMLRNNFSKFQASCFVFFCSAFFHEYVVSVPLRMIKPWAFLSMLMQVPLAVVTSYMKNPWGNFVVWLSLIIGQPLAIMIYYHDYLVEHQLLKTGNE